MNLKLLKFIFTLIVLLIIPFKLFAEFEKEIKLTDEGKCEEALIENNNTSIEEEEKYNPKKPFVEKNTIKIFRIYTLNRKAMILKNNCKRTAEAFEVAKKSLELEKEIYKIPSTKFDKVLQYNEFTRKINLAYSYATVANFYVYFEDFKNGIEYYKKTIEIYESTDLYKKGNLLNYYYSILAGTYNRSGDLKNANILRKKHLDYMGNRYGNKTIEYFDALFNIYYQYSD